MAQDARGAALRILVADSLYNPAALPHSHLDAWSHYLAAAGHEVDRLILPSGGGTVAVREPDVVFAMDQYQNCATIPAKLHIAQANSITVPCPWQVKRPDGRPAYRLILSAFPAMLKAARDAGCRAEFMPLAFDKRALEHGQGVKRDLGAIFIGTTGRLHKLRTAILAELTDAVQVLPPVFGAEYFRALARARVVVNVHCEWSGSHRGNMRIFEASGMGALCITDGATPDESQTALPGLRVVYSSATAASALGVLPNAASYRAAITAALKADDGGEHDQLLVMARHTYEQRTPRLLELIASLDAV